jgi:large subunit ribosomal protein L29
MAKSNYNDLTAQELSVKGREMRQELFNLRLQQATARLEKPHRIRELRREIARCETHLTRARHGAAATTSKA